MNRPSVKPHEPEHPRHDPHGHDEMDSAPESSIGIRRRFSWLWLIPIAAACLVAYLAYSGLKRRGPTVSIRWKNADGLVAEQTQVKYKSVPIGMVEGVDLNDAHDGVVAHVRMDRAAKFLLTDHARFWVVRPRLSAARISGLDTLVSGAYVEVDPGDPGGKQTTTFTGLEDPPGVTSDQPGRTFELKASRLGSLSEGSPVYYRDVQVGSLLKYELGDGLGPVSLRIFVRAPYDGFVHPDTLFWNASGISINMGSDGLHAELESLQTLISGGIAFETPKDGDGSRLPDDAPPFRLYGSKAKADADRFKKETACVAYFQSSVQGLDRGSSVQIFGVQVGAVKDVHLVFDETARHFVARVEFDLQPERMLKPSEYHELAPDELKALVRDGLRAVIDSSNMLTGQKVLSLRYVPGAKPGTVLEEGGALVLPAEGGGLDGITTAVAEITAKINRIPFEEIGANLNRTIRSVSDAVAGPELKDSIQSLAAAMKDVRHLSQQADANLSPALGRIPAIAGELQTAVEHARDALGEGGYGANSDLQRNLANMIDQVAEAARTMRLLADFLDHHPEALLRGRSTPASQR
jgi:paraquat-inducible protein B